MLNELNQEYWDQLKDQMPQAPQGESNMFDFGHWDSPVPKSFTVHGEKFGDVKTVKVMPNGTIIVRPGGTK